MNPEQKKAFEDWALGQKDEGYARMPGDEHVWQAACEWQIKRDAEICDSKQLFSPSAKLYAASDSLAEQRASSAGACREAILAQLEVK